MPRSSRPPTGHEPAPTLLLHVSPSGPPQQLAVVHMPPQAVQEDGEGLLEAALGLPEAEAGTDGDGEPEEVEAAVALSDAEVVPVG